MEASNSGAVGSLSIITPTPLLKEVLHGTVPNVVLPTGINRRDDFGLSAPIDVYGRQPDRCLSSRRVRISSPCHICG